ncbi:MAG TPA: hypothetical protein VIK11_09505, partial [Tepidiformaceae bacterium]
AAVVSRAEHLLGEFEANGHHMAMDGASPDVVQPALFGGPSPVETALAGIDVDGLTPLEAIQKLYELRALLPALARHSR